MLLRFYVLELDFIKRGVVWIKSLKSLFAPQKKEKENISVNVRALPASPSLLRKSDGVCSLSAGCQSAENDRWSVTLWIIFNFSKLMFRHPIWTRLGAKQHTFFAISYYNILHEHSSEDRKQTFYMFMCHSMMSTA